MNSSRLTEEPNDAHDENSKLLIVNDIDYPNSK